MTSKRNVEDLDSVIEGAVRLAASALKQGEPHYHSLATGAVGPIAAALISKGFDDTEVWCALKDAGET